MIFVTVGTHYLGFERLITEMDEIAGKIDEEVVAQIGSTKYKPKNMKYFTFVEDEKEILELYQEARVVVSHAGAGTLLTILNYNKPAVIVPRLHKFNEHIDDHQLELTDVLKDQGKAIGVYDIGNLESSLKKVENLNYNNKKKNEELIIFLKEYITRMKK
jgi:UDP-N-acetylglucosamine transferase subunit ALG13